ncbi:hypothetical protein HK097_007033 [Rhizophlyctis rosea]|uniref:CENP-V/GFA domain-containing protein n=1 Tax=Rhizophlyctis rosea TaxID=64517 RepID=A0AAD5X5W9_9FUNG|nr:hypothetical protein HK097_007033 [Rhizophlyctis rosea]
MVLSGHCLCKAVTYTIDVEKPDLVGYDHCDDCQRQSGSTYSLVAVVPKAKLKINGPIKSWAGKGSSGKAVHRLFCSECGSPIAHDPDAAPEIIAIKAGTLDSEIKRNLKPDYITITLGNRPFLYEILDGNSNDPSYLVPEENFVRVLTTQGVLTIPSLYVGPVVLKAAAVLADFPVTALTEEGPEGDELRNEPFGREIAAPSRVGTDAAAGGGGEAEAGHAMEVDGMSNQAKMQRIEVIVQVAKSGVGRMVEDAAAAEIEAQHDGGDNELAFLPREQTSNEVARLIMGVELAGKTR